MSINPSESFAPPALHRVRYSSIAAKRHELTETAKESKTGKIQAKVNFVINSPKDGRCAVTGYASIDGVKSDETEFEIHLELEALFKVISSCTDADAETPEFHNFITAQLGPLMVVKAKQIMEDLGFNGANLSFFNPYSGIISKETIDPPEDSSMI